MSRGASERGLEFWGRCLVGVSCLFVAVGLCVAFLGSTPVFGVYLGMLGDRCWGGGPVPAELRPLLSLYFGILGASIAGKWVLQAFLARHAVLRGEAWAWRASVGALLVWFVLDSVHSVRRGAFFNVYLVNVWALLIAGLPLFKLRRRILPAEAAPPSRGRARGTGWAILGGAVCLGAGIALYGSTGQWAEALLSPWFRALEAAYFQGRPLPPAAVELNSLFIPLIGSTIAAHGLMLVMAARFAIGRGERWAAWGSLVSILAWFTFDSGLSLFYGAAFNVALINLPYLLIVAPPLIFCLRTSRA